jgi:hypothetical protein
MGEPDCSGDRCKWRYDKEDDIGDAGCKIPFHAGKSCDCDVGTPLILALFGRRL